MAEGSGLFGYGYNDAGGERVSALIDMINGGGAGRAGQEFEGGGILSLIANALFSPYGSEDRARAEANIAAANAAMAGRPVVSEPVPAGPGEAMLRMYGPGSAGGPTRPPTGMPTRLPTGGPGTFAPGAIPGARPAPAVPSGAPLGGMPYEEAYRPSLASPRSGMPPSASRIPPPPLDVPSADSRMSRPTPRPPSDAGARPSELVPPYSRGLPESAGGPSRVSPPASRTGGFPGETPSDIGSGAPGYGPGSTEGGSPMLSFEEFVAGLGRAAEGVSERVLRDLYYRTMSGYAPG